MSGFSTAKIRNSRNPRLEDLVDVQKFPPDEWVRVRLVGPLYSYYEFWPRIRKQDGTAVCIMKLCLDYDHKIQDMNGDVCPYRKGGLRGRKKFVSNAIFRELQKAKPEDQAKHTKNEREKVTLEYGEEPPFECHLKQQGSKSWTPARVVVVPSQLARELQNITELNKRRTKKGVKRFDLSHPKYGMDVQVRYNASKKPQSYSVQAAKQTALSEEELNYLYYPLDVLHPESLEEAKKDWKIIRDKLVTEADEEQGKPSRRKYYDGNDAPWRKRGGGRDRGADD